ncbi:MAG: alpha/beta hydrolase [Candidatus Magasanikbacteria bacterium]|nr:alpha/beta hydrolase [Candidatus Magasanikbacteria bacterium]
MTSGGETVTFLSQGKKIVGVIECPEQLTARAVVFAHGLSNSKDPVDIPLLYRINNALLAAGYITMRFDFFGSGESDGQFCDKTISAMRENFLDALTFLKIKHPEINWIGTVGKSIGGTVLALIGGDPRLSASVLMTMRYSLAPFFAKFWSGQDEVNLSGKVPPTGAVKGKFSLSKNFFAELPQIDADVAKGLKQMARTLVVINEGDEKISLESGREVYDNLSGIKELITIPGHDHELAENEAQITIKVVDFFNQLNS